MGFDWNSPNVPKPAAGNFIKWEMMGVPVEGQVAAIRVVPNRFYEPDKPGSQETVVEVLLTDDRIMGLGPIDLLAKFMEANVQPGDFIQVAWTGNEKMPSGTKKVFTVNVKPSI